MKKLIAMAIVIFMAGFTSTYAQDAPNRAGYQERSVEESAKAMTDKMKEYVPDITKEQYKKLFDINLQYIKDASELANHPGSSDEKVQINTELRLKREVAVKEVLTADQFARLEEGMKQVPKRP